MRLRYVLTIMLGLFFYTIIGCNDSTVDPDNGEISFQNDIIPIFNRHGCLACHGGQNNLFLDSVEKILEGGDHGPAVFPGDADNSLIIQMIGPNPPLGVRMPLGSPPVPTHEVNIIRRWINEGARDN